MILSVTVNGYGKRSSAYEYRVTNRGGQGIINIETSKRNGPVVAAFPVADEDQLMLVTDGGQMIRIPVDDIRIASRNTQGVTLFDVAEDEHVVSVARLAGAAEANGEVADDQSDEGAAGEGEAARSRTSHDRPAHRRLSGHLRPDPQRPSGRHPAGDEAGRPAGGRGRGQYRQGSDVLARGARRAWSRPRPAC